MHRRLKRLLEKNHGTEAPVPKAWLPFLAELDRHFVEDDTDRQLLERSLDISSKELSAMNKDLRSQVHLLETRTAEVERSQEALLNVLEDAKEIENKLKDEHELLSKTMETMQQGVVIVDHELKTVLMNPYAEQALGVTLGEVRGKPISAYFTVYHGGTLLAETERPAAQAAVLNRAMKFTDGEYSYECKSGRSFPVMISVTPIHLSSSSSSSSHVALLFLDMSEKRAAEAKIHELNDVRSHFIHIVSHQLRTPINSIRWNLEALLEDHLGQLHPEQKEFIRVTYEANQEVNHRIHDLLTAMDIEEGRLVIRTEETSLEGLMQSVGTEWHARCQRKNLTCSYDPPPSPLPLISVDAEKIRETMEKLIENAMTYSPNDRTIHVLLRKQGDRVRFEVEDHGIGIPETEQRRVFDRFFRATNAGQLKTDASGLGLFIAKHYVQQHGGQMGFTSQEGKGSTFWFELPMRASV